MRGEWIWIQHLRCSKSTKILAKSSLTPVEAKLNLLLVNRSIGRELVLAQQCILITLLWRLNLTITCSRWTLMISNSSIVNANLPSASMEVHMSRVNRAPTASRNQAILFLTVCSRMSSNTAFPPTTKVWCKTCRRCSPMRYSRIRWWAISRNTLQMSCWTSRKSWSRKRQTIGLQSSGRTLSREITLRKGIRPSTVKRKVRVILLLREQLNWTLLEEDQGLSFLPLALSRISNPSLNERHPCKLKALLQF